MECTCKEKSKIRTEEDKRKLLNRLKRIEGQVRGIQVMIKDDRYCGDIIIQLSAVSNAIKSIANIMLDDHMHTCVIDQVKNNDYTGID